MEKPKWYIECPILANCNGDLAIFDTLAEAEDDIEPQDVNNQLYKVYDCKGQILEIGVREGSTVILAGVAERFAVAELRKALISWIVYVSLQNKKPKSQSWLKQATLEQLVKIRRDYELRYQS